MPLNIKNPEVELLAEEVSKLTKESKTQAIKRALEDRKASLLSKGLQLDKEARVMHFLENRLWKNINLKKLKLLTKEEENKLLGYL